MKPRFLILGAVVILVIAASFAGRGGTSDEALKTTLAALDTKAPAQAESPAVPPGTCKGLTASLRPPTQLPPPGHMPRGSFMEKIYRRGRLVAGVNQNFLLFGYLNLSTGKIDGFEVDLMREVAKAIFGTSDKLELKALTVKQRLPYVQSGRVDLVADAVTITCDRRKQVDFSTVYYDNPQRVLVRSNSRARSLKDLQGKRVCASAGSTPLAVLQDYRPRVIPVAKTQAVDCLVALQEGSVDAISTDYAILLGFTLQDPHTKLIGPGIVDAAYGVAVRRTHPEFVRFVNGVLARMRADGTWARLYDKWLGRFGRTPRPPAAIYNG